MDPAAPLSPTLIGRFAAIVGERYALTDPQDTAPYARSEEHTSELQSQSNLVCRLLLEKKKKTLNSHTPSENTDMNRRFTTSHDLQTTATSISSTTAIAQSQIRSVKLLL